MEHSKCSKMLAIIIIWKPKPRLLEEHDPGTADDKTVCYLHPGPTTPTPGVTHLHVGWTECWVEFSIANKVSPSAPVPYWGGRASFPTTWLWLIFSTYGISLKIKLILFTFTTTRNLPVSCCLSSPTSMIVNVVSFILFFRCLRLGR